MPFSKMADAIGASVTLKLNAQAARMRAAGDPVIHLGGGEPKNNKPSPTFKRSRHTRIYEKRHYLTTDSKQQ